MDPQVAYLRGTLCASRTLLRSDSVWVRCGGAVLVGEHSDHDGLLGNALLAGDRAGDVDDLQGAAALRRDAFELCVAPAPCGADAARIGLRVRQCVAGAERLKLEDAGFGAFGRW